jgi:hypothetical protein
VVLQLLRTVERRRVGDVGDLDELVVREGVHRRVARLQDAVVQERRHGELSDTARRLGPRVENSMALMPSNMQWFMAKPTIHAVIACKADNMPSRFFWTNE